MQQATRKQLMSRQQILEMAQTPQGRIALHLIALRIDNKVEWHISGILRELHGMERPVTHGPN